MKGGAESTLPGWKVWERKTEDEEASLLISSLTHADIMEMTEKVQYSQACGEMGFRMVTAQMYIDDLFIKEDLEVIYWTHSSTGNPIL